MDLLLFLSLMFNVHVVFTLLLLHQLVSIAERSGVDGAVCVGVEGRIVAIVIARQGCVSTV